MLKCPSILCCIPERYVPLVLKNNDLAKKIKKIQIAALAAIALSIPVAALVLFKFNVTLVAAALIFPIPPVAITLVALAALGILIGTYKPAAVAKPKATSVSAPDKYDYFVAEAKRLNFEKNDIDRLTRGLSNIKYKQPVKDIVQHGANADEIYAHQENYLDQLHVKFQAAGVDKDTAKKGALRMLIEGFDECFPRQSITWRYVLLSFNEPESLKEKLSYFIRRFKEEAIQKMVDDQEKTHPHNPMSKIKRRCDESQSDYDEREARIPKCLKKWPMHDANKISLIISLIAEDIGIPTEYSDKKLLQNSPLKGLVDAQAKAQILHSFNSYYGARDQLVGYLKSMLNQPVRAQLLQDYKSAILQAVYQHQDQYAELLQGFVPSNADMQDIQFFAFVENKITQNDSEGRFKFTDEGVQMLLRIYNS